jgi:hypothetical protein
MELLDLLDNIIFTLFFVAGGALVVMIATLGTSFLDNKLILSEKINNIAGGVIALSLLTVSVVIIIRIWTT